LLRQDNHGTITQERLEAAVRCAASQGSLDMVQCLLSDARTIGPQCLGKALITAVHVGHGDVVRFLLSDGRIIDQPTLEECLLGAAYKGHLALVELLVSYGPVRESVRNSAITNASGSDQENIRDILHAARTLPDPVVVDQVEAEGTDIQESVFLLKFSDVKADPLGYLTILVERGFPTRIYVVEEGGKKSPAVDLGGITKQFVTSLCENLVSKNLLYLNQEGLPAKTSKEITHQQLGRLFSLVYEANRHRMDKILTGYMVHECFFEMVRVLATHDEKEGFKQVCAILGKVDPSLQPLVDLVDQPTLEHANAYLTLACLDPLTETDTSGLQECISDARGILNRFYLAAQDFLAGTTLGFRSQLMQGNVQTLARSIQGEPLTQLGILQALRLPDVKPLPSKSQEIIRILASQNPKAIEELQEKLRQESSTESTSFEDMVDWIVREIALKDPMTDQAWFDSFFFAITGKKAMLPEATWRLQKSWREGPVFEMHTCFNGLDVPNIPMYRDAFVVALNFAIKQEGYNIG